MHPQKCNMQGKSNRKTLEKKTGFWRFQHFKNHHEIQSPNLFRLMEKEILKFTSWYSWYFIIIYPQYNVTKRFISIIPGGLFRISEPSTATKL